jgi:hypothetical protein
LKAEVEKAVGCKGPTEFVLHPIAGRGLQSVADFGFAHELQNGGCGFFWGIGKESVFTMAHRQTLDSNAGRDQGETGRHAFIHFDAGAAADAEG